MKLFAFGLILVSLLTQMATANDGCCKPSNSFNGCPCAPQSCMPTCKTVPHEKECYETECKHIAIPAVKLPWECDLKCGTVRTVKLLLKKKQPAGEKVVYEWKLGCCCDGDGTCGACGANGCRKPGCCQEAAPAPSAPLTPAPVPAAASRSSRLRDVMLVFID